MRNTRMLRSRISMRTIAPMFGAVILTQALFPFLCAGRGQVAFIDSTTGLRARAARHNSRRRNAQ